MATLIDLELDKDTHDLVVEGGDLQLVEDVDAITQRLRVTLRHFLGEWYLDTTVGIPYFPLDDGSQSILGKGTSQEDIEAILKDAIIEVEGIIGLLDFKSEMNRTTRKLTVSFSAQSDIGEITETIIIGV